MGEIGQNQPGHARNMLRVVVIAKIGENCQKLVIEGQKASSRSFASLRISPAVSRSAHARESAQPHTSAASAPKILALPRPCGLCCRDTSVSGYASGQQSGPIVCLRFEE